MSPDEILVGSELEVNIYLGADGITDSNAYLLEISHNEAIDSELNIILAASGFQFDGGNTSSFPLDPSAGQVKQTAHFCLTALRLGAATITAELYRGDTFETNLEARVQVAGFDETSFSRTRITTQPRPVPQPDFISESKPPGMKLIQPVDSSISSEASGYHHCFQRNKLSLRITFQ
jgi:hypothetical protein